MGNITAGSFPANGIAKGAMGFLPRDTSHFAAMRVFPVRTTAATTGTFSVDSQGDSQRIDTTGFLSPFGVAERVEVGSALTEFNCQMKGARYLTTHVEAKNAAATGMYDPRVRANGIALSKTLRVVEDEWASSYFKTGVWTDQTTPTVKWNSDDGGDPIGDVGEAIDTVASQLDGGGSGLVLVLGAKTFRTLQRHVAFKDFSGVVNAQGTQMASHQKIAEALGIEDIIVSGAVKNTALDGDTASNSDIVGDGALLLKSAAAFDLNDPTAGVTIVSSPLKPRSYRTEELQPGAFWTEATLEYDFVTPFTGGGVFIDNVME